MLSVISWMDFCLMLEDMSLSLSLTIISCFLVTVVGGVGTAFFSIEAYVGLDALGIGVGSVAVAVDVWFKMVNLSSMEAKFFLTISFRVCTYCKMSFSGEWCHGSTADPSHAEIEFYMMGRSA